jgi:hypothetical protein
MRGSDEIQLLEGPILLPWPCPLPGFVASVGNTFFEAFRLEGPASEYEAEAMCASLRTYVRKVRFKWMSHYA